MLFSILSGGNPQTILISLLLTLPIIVFALSIHETAHGYAAWKCGDNTAYNLGRLSLNPAKHIDLMGTIAMLVFGFGWAKPVPVNTRNFRNHKRGMAITAAAGPLASFALAALGRVRGGAFGGEVFVFSLFLGLLNLLPLASFDGSRILRASLSLLFGESAARAISSALAYAFLFLAWIVSVYILFYSGANFALLLFCAYIFVFTIVKKDCNSRKKVV